MTASLSGTTVRIGAGRALTLGGWVLILPLVEKTYGSGVLGAWVLAQGLAFWSQLLDLGIGVGLQHRLTQGESPHRSGAAVAASLAFTRGQSLAAGCFALAIYLAPAPTWLLGSSAVVGRTLLALGCLAAAIQLPAQLTFRRLAAGDAHGGSALAQGVGSLVGFTLASWLMLAEASCWVAFTCASCAAPVFQWSYGARRLRTPAFVWQRPAAGWTWRGDFRSLASFGLWYAVSQFAALALGQGDLFLVSALVGPEAAGSYGTAARVLGVPSFALGAALSASWPRVSRAIAQGDWQWTQSLYRIGLLVVVALACTSFALSLVAPSLLRESLRHVNQLTLLVYAGLMMAGMWGALHAQCLQAAGKVRICALVAAAQVPIAGVAATIAGMRWGTTGIASALLVTSLALPCLFLTATWRRIVWAPLSSRS